MTTTHDGKTIEQINAEVEEVVTIGPAPFGEDMSCSFQVGNQWYTQRSNQHFEDRATFNAYGIDQPINAEYINWSLFCERDFTRTDNFIYIE